MIDHTCRLDLTKEDAVHVLKLYQQAWWTKERTLESTISVLAGSTHSVGVFRNNSELIGFGRVLTDGVEKATLYDIIIDEQYKGQGLGKMLVEQLMNAPSCRNVQHIELYCKEEMIPFYQKMGFFDISTQVKLLRHKRSPLKRDSEIV